MLHVPANLLRYGKSPIFVCWALVAGLLFMNQVLLIEREPLEGHWKYSQQPIEIQKRTLSDTLWSLKTRGRQTSLRQLLNDQY